MIGMYVNVVAKGIHGFGLCDTFEVEPLKLFTECPISADEINLKIILTGSFTKNYLIQKLKPYTVNKARILRIFEALKDNGFKRYLDICSLNPKNLDTYPDDEKVIPDDFIMRGPMTRSRLKRIQQAQEKKIRKKRGKNCTWFKCG